MQCAFRIDVRIIIYIYFFYIYHKWYGIGLSNLFLYPRKGISRLHDPIIDPDIYYNKLGRSLVSFPIHDFAIYWNDFTGM